MLSARAIEDIMLTHDSTGYGCSIVEREPLLRLLYDQLQKKENIFLNKQVETVTHSSSGVVVKCMDGSEYSGV
jgi:hypothetical protein